MLDRLFEIETHQTCDQTKKTPPAWAAHLVIMTIHPSTRKSPAPAACRCAPELPFGALGSAVANRRNLFREQHQR